MEKVRARADETVQDKDTAEALKPYYRQFCKRPCFNDEYLPSFNLPGVHLIDTDGHGVERFTETGLVANGQEFELDCVIFATGFEVGTDYTRRAGYDSTGRNGQSLKDKWDDGIATLHGMQTAGFPNCFIISQAQSGFTVSFPHAMNEQAKHIAYIIRQVAQSNAKVVEATEDAEQEWVQEIIKMSRLSESFQAECTPGYYNNEGKPNPKSVQNGSYGAGPVKFFKVIEAWREEGGPRFRGGRGGGAPVGEGGVRCRARGGAVRPARVCARDARADGHEQDGVPEPGGDEAGVPHPRAQVPPRREQSAGRGGAVQRGQAGVPDLVGRGLEEAVRRAARRRRPSDYRPIHFQRCSACLR